MQFTREEQIRRRLNWFIEARELGSVSRACKNCGISRKTYYKWWNIYQGSDTHKDSLDYKTSAERIADKIGWKNVLKRSERHLPLTRKPSEGYLFYLTFMLPMFEITIKNQTRGLSWTGSNSL